MLKFERKNSLLDKFLTFLGEINAAHFIYNTQARWRMEPLISVIIPAHNERDYIAEALKSSQRQTYERLETIVVANACSDDTARVAKEFANTVIETPTQGISHAKNLGASVSEGRIFTFMDADSQMKDDLLEKVQEYTAKGYGGGKAKLSSLDDDRLRAKVHCIISEIWSRIIEPIKAFDTGAGAFTFVTRDLFTEIENNYGQGFRTDLQVMEDVDFLGKIKKHGKFKFVTNSCLYTSMRRFKEEGYLKCLVEDIIHVSRPAGKIRDRWTY
jgi:glycosyltransferase involved in cell wall biosynthesis